VTASGGDGGSAGQGSGTGTSGEVAAVDSPEARKKQIENFWDLILERFLDLNSYVRSKTISVCNKLLE
jgi:condensin complex subunit 1